MQTADRYRRVPGLVIFWAGAQAVCFIWKTPARIPISMQVAEVLDALSGWTSPAELRDRIAPGSEISEIQQTIDLLQTLELIEREADTRRHDEWLLWSPEAAFFHFA